jgi:hypothetical protein
MKVHIETKSFTFIDTQYRVSVYHGANLIKIEVFVFNSWWREFFSSKVGGWKTIHFGHSNPIEEAIKFYKLALKK